ncbi:MAG: 2-oxo acid dehydrogenase subunit E2 [Bacteroidales bacterium]|nr:2-oxo acid dehydrogenase subunit E2 [Bacteroidales bacterium]
MADFNLVMPKMGESVQDATITKWMVKAGDVVKEDDVLLEIATDKVDTEIPSPVAGEITKLLFSEGSTVPVGEVIAIINTEGKPESQETVPETSKASASGSGPSRKKTGEAVTEPAVEPSREPSGTGKTGQKRTTGGKSGEKFYSPLVRNIAQKENITVSELDAIQGSGINGRVRKQDVLDYIQARGKEKKPPAAVPTGKPAGMKTEIREGDRIVEMDRMRRIIADHMVMSKHTSPHVTSFIEADVTNLVLWRNKVKDEFLKRENQKITFMPVFVEATAGALKEFAGVNASVDGNNIVLRKDINIGFAVALESGNLIVPVIKHTDQRSLVGLTIELNRLADAARKNSLTPDEIQGGTFTITNFGTFRNLTGTPIIHQPQAAILGTGAIEKKPAVLETPSGDVIAIRHKMILSLSYDHRIIDGALGGAFLRRLADLLEEFDLNRTI